MKTKQTLRMDETLIEKAKVEAKHLGNPASRMSGDFFNSLSLETSTDKALPPLTASLVGVLKGKGVSESNYKKHLKEKYL